MAITETSSTPEGQGSTTSEVTGTDTQTATTEAKTFTQAELDAHIKERLQREKAKFEKDLESKIAEAVTAREKAFETEITDRVKAALAERDLADTKRSIQTEYGLSDAQLSRLTGDTVEALKADAETMFGALKQRKPPVLNPGTTVSDTPLDISKMTPAQIREKSAELLKANR